MVLSQFISSLLGKKLTKRGDFNQMTVDTRYRPRIDLDIDVQVIHRKRCIRARSKNVSSGGIFLVTNATTIPPGTFIGLEFAVDATTWQIDGLVIRQDQDGIVCLFRMPQPELLKSALDFHSAANNNSPAAPTKKKLLNSALLFHPVSER